MIPQGGQCRDPWLAPSPPRAGHGNGAWPESSKYIEEQFGHLPADVAYKITSENAGKFYGLMSFLEAPDRDSSPAPLSSDSSPSSR